MAIYAFLRYNCLSEEQQIEIWGRVFDPKKTGHVEKEDYEKVLFSLAYGPNWKPKDEEEI